MSESTQAAIKAAAATTAVFVVFLGFTQLQAVFEATNGRMDNLIKEANVKLTMMDTRIKKLEGTPTTPAPAAPAAVKK